MNRSLSLFCITCVLTSQVVAQESPAIRTLNTPRAFPPVNSRAEWQERAKEIREQALVSCGLWPMPEKTPLNTKVFGRVERDGYSIEKVWIQTYPGFYLGGNLYRPLGKGKGPFPGILNPHGHWANGRMADTKDGSIAARCISFARQGMVAFSYDMVGYNDTRFPDWVSDAKFSDLHWSYATNRADQLWSVDLMGLQTWNSIRVLDFLESLPDVDKKRLACTGESGGGTQTFMLGAIDNRLTAQAPIVMVSSTMQGGCLCENAPGLRVQYYNVEIAAAAAPRPQLLVAAKGDWTTKTMEVEGPDIERIYKLFGAEDKFKYVRFDFGHNYNQTSREAVYEWLDQRLLKKPDPALFKESPYQKDPDAELRVFPDSKLPDDALPMAEFIEARKREHLEQWKKLVPTDKASFKQFAAMVQPAWKHTIQTGWPKSSTDEKEAVLKAVGMGAGELESLSGTVIIVAGDPASVAGPNWKEAATLRPGKVTILPVPLAATTNRDEFSKHFTTYNRTELQENTGKLIALCEAVRKNSKAKRIVLVGQGRAGVWALLAAPAADAVMADCNGVDVSKDEGLLAPGLFAPGLRVIGTYQSGAMLAAPHPLILHNTQGKFVAADIQATYNALGVGKKLVVGETPIAEDQIIRWAAEL